MDETFFNQIPIGNGTPLTQIITPVTPIAEPVQTAAPFSMGATRGSFDPIGGNKFYRQIQRAPMYQIDPSGQRQEIGNPYATGTPLPPQIQQQQQMMQPQQQMQQGYPQGYQPVTVQPTEYSYPQFLDDPAFQAKQQEVLNLAMDKAIQSQKGPGKLKKGVRVFTAGILPGLVGAFGGGAAGGALAQNGLQLVRQAQMRDLQRESNAVDFLRAATGMVNTLGIKPISQAAKQMDMMAKFNAGAQNTAMSKNQQEQGRFARSNIAEMGRQRRFDTKETRLQQAQNFEQTHKINVLTNRMNEFDRIQDRLANTEQNLEAYRRRSLLLKMRGQDIGRDTELQKMAFRVQENMLDHQFDVNKFNADVELQVGKMIGEGKLPEGTVPDNFMLELEQANSINPTSLGMSPQEYNGLMNEITNFGRQQQGQQATPQQPMQPYPQQLQAVTGQLGQPMPQQPEVAGPQQVPGLVQQGAPQQMQMQQAPPPMQQQQPMQRGALLNRPGGSPTPRLSNLGQQAFQRVQKKYTPEQTKMMLIQRLMQPPYSLTYQEAEMKASGR